MLSHRIQYELKGFLPELSIALWANVLMNDCVPIYPVCVRVVIPCYETCRAIRNWSTSPQPSTLGRLFMIPDPYTSALGPVQHFIPDTFT